MIKLTLQGTAALATVLGLYLSPWLLGLAQQPIDQAPAPRVQAPREAVVWIAPAPPVDPPPRPAASLVATEEVAQVERAHDVEVPSRAPTAASPSRPRAVTRVDPRKRGVRRSGTRATGPTRATVAAKAPREAPKTERPPPTRKELRQKKRWDRKQDRLAKQPQCRDHIGEMVQIEDHGRRSRWMVSEALVSCYRQHPGQFVNLGGMDWSKDDRGRREGLQVFVSSRERGEVARAIGLKRGDVLTSLNGLSLRNPTTATLALTQLVGAHAKLVFQRKGRRHVLQVSVVDGASIAALQRAQRAFALEDARIARASGAPDR